MAVANAAIAAAFWSRSLLVCSLGMAERLVFDGAARTAGATGAKADAQATRAMTRRAIV